MPSRLAWFKDKNTQKYQVLRLGNTIHFLHLLQSLQSLLQIFLDVKPKYIRRITTPAAAIPIKINIIFSIASLLY